MVMTKAIIDYPNKVTFRFNFTIITSLSMRPVSIVIEMTSTKSVRSEL